MGRVICVFDQLENSLDWPTCSDTYLSGQMRKECVEMFVISFVETFRLRGLSLSFFFFFKATKMEESSANPAAQSPLYKTPFLLQGFVAKSLLQ